MSLSEEDSDATVLEDDAASYQPTNTNTGSPQFAPPFSLHVSESPGATVSSPPSPSILHSSLRHLIQQRCSSTKNLATDMKENIDQWNLATDMKENIDQCSDDEMSQEFPPLPIIVVPTTGPRLVVTQGITQDTQMNEPSKDNPSIELTVQPVSTTLQPLQTIEPNSQLEQPTSTNPSPLEAIAQKQTILLQILKRLTPSTIAEQLLTQAKAQAASFEQNLESIGTANQTERKRLAQAHSTLSQRVTSQQELVLESQALQRQLLSLTKKQKHLLECVSRQKDIRAQLAAPKTAQLAVPKTVQLAAPKTAQLAAPKTAQLAVPKTVQLAAPSKITTTQRSTDTRATAQNVHPSMASLQVSSNTLSNRSVNLLPPTTVPTNAQLRPEVLLKPVAVKTTSSADLGEPVPLDTLIKHGFIQPGPNILSCLILGCQFKTSLLADGTLQSSNGETVYHQPQHWVKACWAQLGHPNKKIAKKLAYTIVLFKEIPLINYCDKYSIKQVSSYLSQRTADGGTDSRNVDCHPVCPVPTDCSLQKNQATSVSDAVTTSTIRPRSNDAPQPQATDCATPHPTTGMFNLGQLLREGSVLLLPPVVRGCSSSLTLPHGFWSSREVSLTPQLVSQIQSDLDW